jgi:nitrogen fixation-related uncharacterized protein
MFIRFWLLWLLLGLAVATWVLSWAIRTRQFEEPRRAALLPFDDVEVERPPHTRTGRFHLWFIWVLVAVGIALSTLSLILSLLEP